METLVESVDPHDMPVLEPGVPSMEAAYSRHRLLATSTYADIYLIRTHIAYHLGFAEANRARITSSRGHSYRVRGLWLGNPKGEVVRISDHYDHRDGVVGLV